MTEVYLINNVNFPSDYTDVVDFETIEQQRSYFNSRKVMGYDSEATYLRDRAEMFRLKIPKIDVEKYSYFMFTNTSLTGNSKTYYAFITNVIYVQPDITQVEFKVDVWQTYMFDYEIKDTFIDRQHEDRWYYDGTLKPIFNLQQENIEVGKELVVKSREKIIEDDVEIYWLAMITTTGKKDPDASDLDYKMNIRNLRTSLYVYLIPYIPEISSLESVSIKRPDGGGTLTEPLFSGRDIYGTLYKFDEDPTVMSIRFLPHKPFKYTVETTYSGTNLTSVTIVIDSTVYNQGIRLNSVNNNAGGVSNVRIINVENYTESIRQEVLKTITFTYPYTLNKNNPVNIDLEPKLKTRPYRSYSVTNYQMDSLIFGEENIGSESVDLKYIQSFDINAKQKIYLDGYLNDDGKLYCAIDTKMQELPLITDAWKNYIASNRATATTGLAINKGLAVAGAGIAMAGFATGLPLSYLGIGTGISGAMGVKNELLKQSDLKQTPDAIKDSGNNMIFDIQDNNLKMEIVMREVKDEYRNILFNYLMRFGYKSNKFGIPNLRSRYYYNYIKVITIQMNSNLPNHLKEQIKSIYQNGTTIWHYRTDNTNPTLFDYTKENVEMSVI
ncbi:MAG: Tail protein [Candidatus Moranbacteria bacterium GW2011_GWF2_35_39]|nr:MAG: Tail protein [Candidatus Moranbacteria bacterium GW2011_GWF2_35_39]